MSRFETPAGVPRAKTERPAALPALTSMRFFAAMAVVLHHLKDFAPDAPGGALVARGGLSVDFFFVLSGYILTHAHGDAFRGALGGWLGFLRARIARIYPAHLVVLALFGVLALIGSASGAGVNAERYGFGALLSHLFLVNAWGGQTTLSWNYPAWSISAEWAAYLAFPALAFGLTRLSPRQAGAALAGLAALFLVLAPRYGWTLRTVDCALWRIFPEFVMGILARLAFAPGARALAGAGFLVCLACVVGGVVFGAGDAWIVIGFVALTALGGRLGGLVEQALAHPWLVRLGEESYSLYLVHVLVFGLLFKAAGPLVRLGLPAGALWPLAVLGAVIAASLLHRFVEKPGRALVLRAPAPWASMRLFSFSQKQS